MSSSTVMVTMIMMVMIIAMIMTSTNGAMAPSAPSSSPSTRPSHPVSILDELNHYEMTIPRYIINNGMTTESTTTSDTSSSSSSSADKMFEVAAFGRTYRIIAEPSKMFGDDYHEIMMNGATGEIINERRGTSVQTDCWFTGRVDGDDKSIVSLSTCSDQQITQSQSFHQLNSIKEANIPLSLTASIKAFGEQIFIQSASSLPADRLSSVYETGHHIAYRASDRKPFADGAAPTCGVTKIAPSLASIHSENDHAHHVHHAPSTLSTPVVNGGQRRLLTGNSAKYPEFYLVNDITLYGIHGNNVVNMAKGAFNHAYIDYVNTVFGAYTITPRLVGMITISLGSDPWGVPLNSTTPPYYEVQPSNLLSKFNTYMYSVKSKYVFDQATLLSGYDFQGSTIGLAGVGAMCGTTSGCIVQGSFSLDANMWGTTMAHEWGHNFNMQHDASGAPYIMAPAVNNPPRTTFSDVSINATIVLLDGTRATCMENVPTRNWVNTTAVCGDGIVQTGEQCDCGANNCTTVNPCCNQATCQLVSGATCSTTQACCDRNTCKPATDRRVCRVSGHADCDIAEKCNSASADCPVDTYEAAGKSCTWTTAGKSYSGSGLCYAGTCRSHGLSCFTLAESGYSIVGQCRTGVSGYRNDERDTSCTTLPCNITGYANTCPFYPSIALPDGVPCLMNGNITQQRQCYNKTCTLSSDFPLPPVSDSGSDDSSSALSTMIVYPFTLLAMVIMMGIMNQSSSF